MTQRRAPNAMVQHKALAGFLAKAKEHTLRAYLETVLGALAARAATTKSGVDDIAIVVITVLVDRLFPQEDKVESQGNGDPPF